MSQNNELVLRGAGNTTLALPKDLTFEEWQQAGETLGRMERATQWWIGDWLNIGEAQGYISSDHYDKAERFFPHLERKTLWEYAHVARQSSIRMEELSFGHHQAVVALDPPRQQGWLEEAAAERWPISELRKQVKGEPEEEPERCPTCGHRLPKGAQVRRPRRRGKP